MVKTNFKHEFKPNLICNSCKLKESNQSQLLYFNTIIGRNQLVTYIPRYEDICNYNNIEKLNFIAQIMMTNLKRKTEIEG